MSHHLTALISSAVVHLFHPHARGHPIVHPFGEGVKPLGEAAALPDGTEAYAEGKRRLNSGDLNGALSAFREAVAQHPDSSDALDGIAVTWDRLGRPDLARLYYEAALSKAPDSAAVQNNLGYSYLLAGDFALARPLLEKAALAAEPKAADAARRSLVLMERSARSPPAAPDRSKAPAALGPVHHADHPTPIVERISATRVRLITHPEANAPQAESAVGRSRDAVATARSTAPSVTPRSLVVLVTPAAPVSAESVNPTVSLRPVFASDDPVLNAFAARVHPFRSRRAETQACGTTVKANPAPAPAPDDAQALQTRIEAALQGSSPDEARPLIDAARGLLPTPLFELYTARLALRSGDSASAALGFAPLTRDPSVAARAWAGLGEARLRQKRAAPAAEALDQALKLDPSAASTWVMRGVAADMLRDWPAANLAYDRAVALDPKSAVALTDRGYSRLLRGQYTEALSDLRRAMELDPHSKVAATDLRVASVMSGDYKTAMAGVGKEDVAGDLNTIGFAAMARGDYDRAEIYFTRAMEINPKFDHVAWDNLVYLKQLVHAAPGSTSAP